MHVETVGQYRGGKNQRPKHEHSLLLCCECTDDLAEELMKS